jgi:hypothetical protein
MFLYLTLTVQHARHVSKIELGRHTTWELSVTNPSRIHAGITSISMDSMFYPFVLKQLSCHWPMTTPIYLLPSKTLFISNVTPFVLSRLQRVLIFHAFRGRDPEIWHSSITFSSIASSFFKIALASLLH